MYYECMEVVFIPQITVFLPDDLYQVVYRKAKEANSTTSGIMRGLAERNYRREIEDGRKKGK